jgi:hypothetical protein
MSIVMGEPLGTAVAHSRRVSSASRALGSFVCSCPSQQGRALSALGVRPCLLLLPSQATSWTEAGPTS